MTGYGRVGSTFRFLVRKGNPEEYLILISHIETVPRSFISVAQLNSYGPIKLSRLSDPIAS